MNAVERQDVLRGKLLRDEPMARHTSWRVGGPADRYFEPADREDLLAFVRELPVGEPVLWIGLGSNLLVRDGGWRGTVIALHGALDGLRLDEGQDANVRERDPVSSPGTPVGAAAGRDRQRSDEGQGPVLPSGTRHEYVHVGSAAAVHGRGRSRKEVPDPACAPAGTTIYAEAGVHCARLAKFAEKNRLAGLGFMAGIPGTVGGALAMNAGAWGGETWPAVAEVEVVFAGGAARWLAADEVKYGYRHVELPEGALGFLAARFGVAEDADGSHAAATRTQLARRKATQPVGRPSAGSTFRNPPDDFAARLVEAAGLKGYRLGGARVAEQHANFILTDADARAADVEALIAHVQRVVAERSGITLVPEVRVVGETA